MQGLNRAAEPPTRTRSASRMRWRVAMVGLVLLGFGACAGRAPPQSFAPSATERASVVVQRGDTLLGLARRHGVQMRAMATANGLSHPYIIRPGQVLHIPGRAVAPPLAAMMAAAPSSALGTPVPPQTTHAPTTMAALGSSSAVSAEPLSAPTSAAPPPTAVASVQVEALPLPPTPPAAVVDSRPAASPAPEVARAPARARPAADRPPRRLPPGRFAWPVQGRVVSSFGSKGGGLVNDGLNIAAPRNTAIRAAGDGTVLYAGNEVRGYGNLILLRHDGGFVTAYGHAERVLVRQGQRVRLGQEIGQVGSSGSVTTPQLHFQVRRDGKAVDPVSHLERRVVGR